MMFTSTILVVLCASSAALAAEPGHGGKSLLFDSWKNKYGKTYASTTAENLRSKIFWENDAAINKHNEGEHTWYMGHNQFSDLTQEEFAATILGVHHRPLGNFTHEPSTVPPFTSGRGAPPSSLDWRKEGAVTPVVNQGQCVPATTVATIGVVEGVHAIATGHLIPFSTQQVVACCPAGQGGGCSGAYGLAYECIIQMGGLDPASAYPNTGSAAKCKVNKTAEIKHVISNFTSVPRNEGALLAAVEKNPVAILVDAQQGWQMYAGGVLTGSCGSQLCHAALVVGYTQDYWIVKNSWGAMWGDHGYIYLKRGDCASTGGECGMLTAASYAIV